MTIHSLDHVNLRTADLDRLVAWYGQVLDMHPGWRPDFGFPGAWLYAGDLPILHLVAVEAIAQPADPPLEHFALGATGYEEFVALLDDLGVPFRPVRLEDAGVIQINIHDPDGNHIHVDFPLAEAG